MRAYCVKCKKSMSMSNEKNLNLKMVGIWFREFVQSAEQK